MTINYTTLLGLAQPVTGTEAGTWGDTVNTEITALLEDAIADAATFSVTSGDVTLTTTNGAANQARMAILLITGTPGVSRNIIAPSQSKWYIVKNGSDAAVVLKGSATTGVTIGAGSEALCFWNGSDFEIAGLFGPSSSTDNAIARFDSTTGKVIQNSGVTIDDSNNVSGVVQLNATTADLTNIEVTNIKAKDGTASATIADSTGVFTHSTTTIFPAGAVGTPAITTTGDTNTGIFFPAADTIAASTGGSERMRITSAGLVGIGTTTPSTLLDITQTDNTAYTSGVAGNFITLLNNSTSTDAFCGIYFLTGSSGTAASAIYSIRPSSNNSVLAFATESSNTVAERMRIDSSGNVGIGTSSPAAKLDVNGQGRLNSIHARTLGGSASGFLGGQSDWTGGATNNSFAVAAYTSDICFFTNNSTTERMRIDSSGNVGIGTTSPSTKLTVYDATAPQVTFNNGTSTFIVGNNSGGNNHILYGTGAYPMIFYTNATETMRIDSSGNVGIGVTPSAWGSGNTVIDIGASGALLGSLTGAGVVDLYYNNFFNGSNSIYKATGFASYYRQLDGNHIWYNAASGTAGNTITFTERARITSGGYFKQSNNGTYINSTGSYNEFNNTADSAVSYFSASNASYTNDTITTQASRSANAAYGFFGAYSGNSDKEFGLYGDGNGKCDGSWTGGGADYAEYFESVNGQELTLGATVVLDNGKVREATAQDPASAIIGVVRTKKPSKASAFIGNAAWNKWAKKYLTDDFDQYIMEDHDVLEWEEQVLEKEAVEAVEAVMDEDGNEVSPAVPAQEAIYKTKKHSYESHNVPEGITVPADAVRKTHDDKGNKFQHYKLNPAWDKNAEYTPREQRPEWNIIGLVGQVKVLKGQPTNDRWVKMRDVSATVEEWFIR